MTTNRIHKVFLYSLAISLIAIFITLASKVFPIANLPLSTNLIIVGTCLANFASVVALIVGIVTFPLCPLITKGFTMLWKILCALIATTNLLTMAYTVYMILQNMDKQPMLELFLSPCFANMVLAVLLVIGITTEQISLIRLFKIFLYAQLVFALLMVVYVHQFFETMKMSIQVKVCFSVLFVACGIEIMIVSATIDSLRKKLNPAEGLVVSAFTHQTMLTNRAFRILTYLFGSINIFFVLVILSMGAEQLLIDWRTAIYELVVPCALNILFAMCWIIGAGLWRPALIAMFKYFSYIQMVLLAAVILYSAYYTYAKGLSSNLLTVMSLLTSLFFLCLMEVLIAIGTERAIAKERNVLRLVHTGQEMSDWSHT
uniref:Uncharacterized protein n=1 Tax=Anopheles minimus TaxID=112268 RepID=A0A182WCA9_9DIPT